MLSWPCKCVCPFLGRSYIEIDLPDMFIFQDEQSEGNIVGIDLESGEPFDPTVEGIWDNYRVKRQMLNSW